MILELPKGAVEFPVPERLKCLIPENYILEAVKLADGVETIAFSIIKIKNVTCKLIDIDFELSDNELISRIIDPMLRTLNRI